MRKFTKYLWSWTFPAVILFLVIMGNMSSAAQPDAGVMCPPKRPADGGICDPKKLIEEEDTPPIPALPDAGKIEKKKVKIQFKGRDLDFIPTGSNKVVPASPSVDADAGVPKWVSERRIIVWLTCRDVREAMENHLKRGVMLRSILFAQTYSEKADAAICVFTVGESKTMQETDVANMFLFSKGMWSVMPTDLVEMAP